LERGWLLHDRHLSLYGHLHEWHLRNFNSAGGPSITPLNFGAISDKPITGDYN